MYRDEVEKEWRGGMYLTTVKSSFEADLLESKLRSEDIPCVKRYRGASNALEILMGTNVMHPIDLYVPKETLEDAMNIIVAIPILDDDLEGEWEEEVE